MAETALKGMTVDEFLHWEDGTDTRYELVDGIVMAMAPPAPAHGILLARLAGAIDAALRSRRPCVVQGEAGIVRPDRDDTCYIADLAVTCEPLRTEDRLIRSPVLIAEILPPSTAVFDRQQKVADYRRIATVQEILLIDSQTIFAEVLRREAAHWITEIVEVPAATLTLRSVPVAIAMAELYEGIPLPAPPAGRSVTG
jgi:Uma2 family endonuclease